MPNQVQARREKLLRLLQADTFASVESLSARLCVSPLTIRRDLDALQALGQVERMHGGARAIARVQMDPREISFYTRQNVQVAEKQAIARAALGLLRPEEVVLVDASTSGYYFARAIPRDFSLTLLTYSAYLPLELAGHPRLEVISSGGVLYRKSLCYLGEAAGRELARFHARRAFLGVKGLALQAGCTDALLPEVELKAALLQQVEELIILADHTKLGNVGLAAFAPLARVTTLVTDAGAAPAFLAAVRARGVQVIAADPLPVEA